MREILFRGKRKNGTEWVYGNYCGAEYLSSSGIEHLIIEIPRNGCSAQVDPETIGQYTGLTDKNGKKIFEGDIVRYPDCVNYDEVCNEGFVDWCEETMRFYFTERWSVEMEDFYVIDKKMIDVEIIGNIHDNPELLKEG